MSHYGVFVYLYMIAVDARIAWVVVQMGRLCNAGVKSFNFSPLLVTSWIGLARAGGSGLDVCEG